MVGMHCYYERTSLARLSRARQDQWDKHFEPQQSLFHAGATSRTSKTFTASPGTADFRGRQVKLAGRGRHHGLGWSLSLHGMLTHWSRAVLNCGSLGRL